MVERDPPRRGPRTDARRNRERLLAVAHEAFAEGGPETSLAEIARRAGVGQGTLYRHFPSRAELLRAVLADRIERLCLRAAHLSATEAADAALAAWLRLFLDHARVSQGLAGAFMIEKLDLSVADCHQAITAAAAGLLDRARLAGTVRADLRPEDLLALIVGIALTTARDESGEQADRLLALALDAARQKPAPRTG